MADHPTPQRPLVGTHGTQQNNGDTRHSKRYSNFNMKPPKISESEEEYFRPRPRQAKVNSKVVTTDTEPEMREFNLAPIGSDKKSKKQMKPMYSTSETEEEYQAFLRSKPKWHGKGGHKDSWDPLLIASPPQIVQRPVGVVQKPKPQAQIAQKVERRAQVYPVSLQIYPGVTLAEQMRQYEENTTAVISPAKATTVAATAQRNQVNVTEPPLTGEKSSKLEPSNSERIQKSGSIIEVREKQGLVPSTVRIQKSNSVVEVKPVISSKQFQPDANDAIKEHAFSPPTFSSERPIQQGQISKQVEFESNKTKVGNINENDNCIPIPRSKESSVITERTPDGMQANDSLQIPLSSNDSEDQTTPKAPRKFYMPKQTSVDSTNSFSENDELFENQAPQMRTNKEDPETQKKKEIQKNLMSEALKKVELRSNKQKQFNQLNRTNPTIAAIGIMTRKELKMESMEKGQQGNGEKLEPMQPGNLPKFLNGSGSGADPTVLQHFKEQSIYKQQNTAKRTENQNAAIRQALIQAKKAGTPMKPDTLPKPTEARRSSRDIAPEQQNIVPVVILKKQPRRLEPEELKARKTSIESQKSEGISGKMSTQSRSGSRVSEPVKLGETKSKSVLGENESVKKEGSKVAEIKSDIAKFEPPANSDKTMQYEEAKSEPIRKEVAKSEPKRSEVRSDTNFVTHSENVSTLAKSAGQVKEVTGTGNVQGQPLPTTRKLTAPSSMANSGEEQQAKSSSMVNSPQVKRASLPAISTGGKQPVSNYVESLNTPTKTTPSGNDRKENPVRSIENTSVVQMAQNQQKSVQKPVTAKTIFPDIINVTSKQNESLSKHSKNRTSDNEVSETERKSLEIEDKGAAVKKAAEKFESGLANMQKSDSLTSLSFQSYNRGRAKSFGNALLEQFEEDQDPEKNHPKQNTPWAGRSPPVIKRRDALRNKGYALQLSKSSDSITAAKLLAKARAEGAEGTVGGLRINQSFSKSIERQIDIYSKTKEDIRQILLMAKSGSVTDRVKMFTGLIHKDQDAPEVDQEEKADAIRREIQEARAQAQETVSDTEIDFQEPIESKVKPLKIPMKPKIMTKPEKKPANNNKGGLRINNSNPENSPKLGLRINHPRHEESPKRGLRINKNDSPKLERHSSIEDLPSVKSKIQNYLTVAEELNKEDDSKEEVKKLQTAPMSQQESHRDKGEMRRERVKKSPKLLSDHYLSAGQTLEIYAQSATDVSADENDTEFNSRKKAEATKKSLPETKVLSKKDPGPHFLQVPVVPNEQMTTGIMKSKSFAAPNQFEGLLDFDSITSKKETMMAFFNANINKTSPVQSNAKASKPKTVRRNSITSITDEILGEEDLQNVDDEFESLLNSTFESETTQRKASTVSRQSGSTGGTTRNTEAGVEKAATRGKVAHAPSTSQRSSFSSSVGTGALGGRPTAATSSNKASADRKISEPVIGSPASTTKGQIKKSPSAGSHSALKSGQMDQRWVAAEESGNQSRSASEDRATPSGEVSGSGNKSKQKRFDPIAALPTSHTKKYLPRQQSLRVGTPPAAGSPSPTQSEYDTCDQWDDY